MLLGMPLDKEIRYRRDIDCSSPKDSGKGSSPTQKFYFDEKWQACLAFKYNGEGGNNNRYNSIDECTQACRHLDGSVCVSPAGSKAPLSGAMTGDCDQAKCPDGYSCRRGMFIECCHDAEMKEVDIAYSDKCPDKSKAGGVNVDYFQAIFAKTCD
uniref:BPTI/Kunitz inhibitor domain-containing protein n=1 Tax=Panagrolaimus sp. JU765 TaxID=591449 RepID=A0AC34R5H6_9BILA